MEGAGERAGSLGHETGRTSSVPTNLDEALLQRSSWHERSSEVGLRLDRRAWWLGWLLGRPSRCSQRQQGWQAGSSQGSTLRASSGLCAG